MNKSKFAVAMALALTVIASNQVLAMADDAVQKPDVAISETTAPAVKYDVDYMDEGVRVIIPHTLPQTRVGSADGLMDITFKGTSLLSDKYKGMGYVVNPLPSFSTLFTHQKHLENTFVFSQFVAFIGRKEKLAKLNESYAEAQKAEKTKNMVGDIASTLFGAVFAIATGSAGAAAIGTGPHNNETLRRAKFAVFDGYQDLPLTNENAITIMGTTTGVFSVANSKNEGIVILITPDEKFNISVDVLTRAIIKAQNIVKTE